MLAPALRRRPVVRVAATSAAGVAAAGLLLLATACAGGSGTPTPSPTAVDAGPPEEASCPSDLPSACPSPPPSFRADIQPILLRRCGACHTDGGVAASSHDFSTYDAVFAQRGPVLNQIYACVMPPPAALPPIPDERAKLLAWLICRAPNN